MPPKKAGKGSKGSSLGSKRTISGKTKPVEDAEMTDAPNPSSDGEDWESDDVLSGDEPPKQPSEEEEEEEEEEEDEGPPNKRRRRVPDNGYAEDNTDDQWKQSGSYSISVPYDRKKHSAKGHNTKHAPKLNLRVDLGAIRARMAPGKKGNSKVNGYKNGLVIQSIGYKAERPCHYCQNRKGPFTECKYLPFADRKQAFGCDVNKCGNCTMDSTNCRNGKFPWFKAPRTKRTRLGTKHRNKKDGEEDEEESDGEGWEEVYAAWDGAKWTPKKGGGKDDEGEGPGGGSRPEGFTQAAEAY